MSDLNSKIHFKLARLVVVMGVSGCGKSTVGAALSERMGKPFIDADDFHPQINLAKMSSGIPLGNDDRWPWLERVGKVLGEHCRFEGLVICACSALRREYREYLKKVANEPILFVYLNGSAELISRRLCVRSDHFMPSELLESQFAILQPPSIEENVLSVDIDRPVSKVIDHIYEQISFSKYTD